MNRFGWMLLAALAPGLALAGNPTSESKPAATAATAEEGLVCKREKPMGSNLSRKVCTTAKQRQEARDKAQNEVARIGRCATQETPCQGEEL